MIKVYQHALINTMLKKKMRPIYVLMRPTEKVGHKWTTSGKNESMIQM